jgi:inorganic pyrophosphatase
VPTRDPRAQTVFSRADIDQHTRREIEHFFRIYKELEGKQTETRGWAEATEAKQALLDTAKNFTREIGRED